MELKPREGVISQTSFMLWQPLDQCPMKVQAINLTGGISSGEHELCNS